MNKDAAEQFKHESMVDREQVAEYLASLSQAFRDGRLQLNAGEESLDLQPGEPMRLKLKAEQDEGRSKLSLNVSWEQPQEPDGTDLRIETGSSKSTPA